MLRMTFLGVQPSDLYLRQAKVRRVIQHELNDIAKEELDDSNFDAKVFEGKKGEEQSLYVEINPEDDINFHVTGDGFIDYEVNNVKDPDIFPVLKPPNHSEEMVFYETEMREASRNDAITPDTVPVEEMKKVSLARLREEGWRITEIGIGKSPKTFTNHAFRDPSFYLYSATLFRKLMLDTNPFIIKFKKEIRSLVIHPSQRFHMTHTDFGGVNLKLVICPATNLFRPTEKRENAEKANPTLPDFVPVIEQLGLDAHFDEDRQEDPFIKPFGRELYENMSVYNMPIWNKLANQIRESFDTDQQLDELEVLTYMDFDWKQVLFSSEDGLQCCDRFAACCFGPGFTRCCKRTWVVLDLAVIISVFLYAIFFYNRSEDMESWRENTYESEEFHSFRAVEFANEYLRFIACYVWFFLFLRFFSLALNATTHTSTFYRAVVIAVKNLFVFLILGTFIAFVFGYLGWILFHCK